MSDHIDLHSIDSVNFGCSLLEQLDMVPKNVPLKKHIQKVLQKQLQAKRNLYEGPTVFDYSLRS